MPALIHSETVSTTREVFPDSPKSRWDQSRGPPCDSKHSALFTFRVLPRIRDKQWWVGNSCLCTSPHQTISLVREGTAPIFHVRPLSSGASTQAGFSTHLLNKEMRSGPERGAVSDGAWGCPEGEPGVPGGIPSPSSLVSLVTLQRLHLPCTKYL